MIRYDAFTLVFYCNCLKALEKLIFINSFVLYLVFGSQNN